MITTDYRDGRSVQELIENEAGAQDALRRKMDELSDIYRLVFQRLSAEQQTISQTIAEQGNRHERRKQAALERRNK